MIYWVLLYTLITPGGGGVYAISMHHQLEQEFHYAREFEAHIACRRAVKSINEMRFPPGQRIEGARCEPRIST